MKFIKKNLRYLCLVIIFCLLISVFIACGDKAQGSNADGTKTEISKEKPVLKWLMNFWTWDPENDPVILYMKEKTGYTIDFYMLPAENANEKLYLDMASGVEYDMMNLKSDQFFSLLENNVLISLEDAIDDYGENLKKAISEKSWNITTKDGEKYGIPSLVPMNFISKSIGIREDVLKDIGATIPTTIDEFYSVLQKVKAETDLIPFTTYSGANVEAFESTIGSGFGLSTYWKDVDGALVPLVKQEGYKKYLEFMAKLYSEGLLDEEMPINKLENVREKFTSGQAAMNTYSWGEHRRQKPALLENTSDAKIGFVPALIGENGEQEIIAVEGVEVITCISKSSQNPEHVIQFANLKLEAETFKLTCIGEEGVHHTLEDGSYYPILPKFQDDLKNSNWFRIGVDEEVFGTYWQCRVKKFPDMFEAFEEIMKGADVAKTEPTAFASSLEKSAKFLPQLRQMENDYMIKVIAGVEKLADYDEFIKGWEEAGGLEVIEEANNWYK